MYTNFKIEELFFYFFSLVSLNKMNYTKKLWDIINISYVFNDAAVR